MEKFDFIDDVQAWLAPMNYEEFWRAIGPHCLAIYPREECDALIADGEADHNGLLRVLKALACQQLTKRHGLTLKPVGPVLRVVGSSAE